MHKGNDSFIVYIALPISEPPLIAEPFDQNRHLQAHYNYNFNRSTIQLKPLMSIRYHQSIKFILFSKTTHNKSLNYYLSN